MSKDSQIVEFTRCYDPYEARIIQSFLKSHGIQATLGGAEHASVDWLVQIGLRGTQIFVPVADLEKAHELTKEQADEDFEPLPREHDKMSPLKKLFQVLIVICTGIPIYIRRKFK